MIVVYLKNGEKAPMPDADSVRREADASGGTLLRCFYGSQEVGEFKDEEVAGYTMAATAGLDEQEQKGSPDPWFQRLES